MSRLITLLGTATLLTVGASAGSAQPTQVAANIPRSGLGTVRSEPVSVCCLSKLTPEEAARIARDIEDAGALTLQGRMTEARRILREVIERQERADAYPAVALQMLANVEFSLDRPIVAAGTLVRLADAAATAGDPATELHALLDAAVLYEQSGRSALARSLRPRVRRLLNSPAIPQATREEVARRFVPE